MIMIGQQIANYNVISLLGSGGMGDVYLAEHKLIGRKVAIKSLHANLINSKQLRKRFKSEASALALLEHKGIVGLHDYIESNDGLYLIMEYVEGQQLDEYINKETGPIVEEKLIPLFTQLLQTFDYLHKKKIVHRDIKPSNILIDNDGKTKLLDFGIAKILEETNSLTKTGSQMGTILYMSPEQVRGEKVDQLSDIYSLGVLLFHMATGKCPYDTTANEYHIFKKIDNEPLPKASSIYPGISGHLEAIIQFATAKKKSERIQSCEEFKELISLKTTAVNNSNTKINKVPNSKIHDAWNQIQKDIEKKVKPNRKVKLKYYFLSNYKENGPYTIEEIKSLIKNNKNVANSFIRSSNNKINYAQRIRIKNII